MSKHIIGALLLVLGGALFAQAPSERNKAAARKKAPALLTAAPNAQPKKAARAEPGNAAAARPSEQEAEESVVMIDSKAEAEDEGAAAGYGVEQDERIVPGGLPSSYGQCKGVLNDAGRSILIFENPEDGAVSFVQVAVGKANVSWKLIDHIARSSD